MRRLSGALVFLSLAAACGGGDGDGGGPPGGSGGGTFRATIDGVPWTASAGTVSVSGLPTASRQGLLVLSGAEASSGIALTIALAFFIGPATQPMGVNTGTTPGGTGGVVAGSKSWVTPLDGASGFVTVTARTADRLAGTFNFKATAAAGTSPATVDVTAGSFDVTVPGGLPPLPTGVGSTAVATLGGAPWNAATIVGLRPGAGVFGLAADNTVYSISLQPKVPVTAGNTYGIPSQMNLSVLRVGTSGAWYGGLGADVGTVTITTFETNRLVATFQATLPALTAGASLTVTGGAVNAYLGE